MNTTFIARDSNFRNNRHREIQIDIKKRKKRIKKNLEICLGNVIKMEEKEELKIHQLTTENIKCIKAITIKPDGNTVFFSGKNGAGKSAALDSINMALTSRAINKGVIRKGESTAKISLDLGKYIVERTIKAGRNALLVRSPEGLKYQSPQTLISTFYNDMCIDPLMFMNLSEKEQVQYICDMIKFKIDTKQLPIDFDMMTMEQINQYRKTTFDNRTAVGRDARNRKERLDAVAHITRVESVDIKGIVSRKDELTTMISEHRSNFERREQIGERITQLTVERDRIESELLALTEEVHDLDNKIELTDMTGIYDEVEQLQSKIGNADAINKQASEYEAKLSLEREHFKFTGEYNELSTLLDKIDELKKETIKRAIPINGLEFDDVVRLNGIPIKTLSTSEQWKLAIQIAMVQNPTLKVIIIKEGNLLDKDSMKMICDIAQEHGYQIWIEVVSDEPIGVYIEDGEISEIEQTRAKELSGGK